MIKTVYDVTSAGKPDAPAIGDEAYAKGRYEDAAQLMIDLVEQRQFTEFLTLPAYDRILADEKAAA